MAKKIAKPAPKPTPKPTPKPLPRPKPAQIDLVRNPNFDAAMAQQEYQNLVRQQSADIRARISAEQNAANALGVKYIATMGTSKTMQPAGNQDFIDSRDKFNANLMPEEEKQRLDKLVADFAMQGAGQLESDIARRNAAMMQYDQAMRAGGAGYAQVDPNTNMPSLMPIQTPRSDALNQDLANRGMGGGVPTPIPQNQQMQSYQNFLNQGMSNMASVNQGAAANFANTQLGMQAPQAGIGQTKGPNMPSIGMQQRRPNPPRKFSTVSNSPARFA